MTKRCAAKVGEYEKDGQMKGEYVNIGVILSNEKGEYLLLDPTVNLAGVLMKQRVLAQKNQKKGGDMVSCGIFEKDRQQAPQQNPPSGSGGEFDSFDDDSIPF